MCTAVENMFLLDMSNELWLYFKWIGMGKKSIAYKKVVHM